MSDANTNIQQLKDLVAAFVEERRWSQFHSPKNLSMSIAIEAAELMELFQWDDGTGNADIPRERVREELADVVIYCLSLANATGIDLSKAIQDKVVANAQKYPVDRYLGRYK
ncbi:nucleotide pyrophosphohydrolase [Desulfallas thermosapovorans]|uniref:NTP pyrophosphatase (Non-canonical NTP hydrolase) n=1 Tax=Desulfallas thermosapovorans DSM 6562 TaxID=1121431 RepID=A0A5S4ZNN0_9FIRM|nr:nucleotide pyrophosphohydrolase [Desulfallas thermosapovorans]TYO94423.1 NTP pyrophosphatase (non-canonical NTP hydrolase) [Desulfallas thermosapovorans DSM 6562]